jgi:DNA-directed RNA polymerase subunit RPC12/RpoP
MKNIDITDKVSFREVDGESLNFIQCACGHKFKDWNFCLSIYEEDPATCPNCGRKMFFRIAVCVYSIE